MPQVKRVMTEQVEERVIDLIIEQVKINNMTIFNLKEITDKVINYLESNAILEMEDPASTKSSITD
jgi:hypothetical protein